MIDLHSHILPGIDDGARTLSEAREMARRASAEGVTAIAATPHVRADWPTSAERMEAGVDELRRDFAEQGIGIEVLHGGELDAERLGELSEDEVHRFTLAQNGRYVLLEFPYSGWTLAFDAAVQRLLRSSLVPLLAHPERNRTVQEGPERLAEPVGAGALVQVTAASLDGRVGRSAQAAGRRLLELGLVHVLASDAHAPEIREIGLAAAVKELGDEGLARYLTVEAPGAIVAGEPVAPPHPARRRRFGIF